VTYLEITLDDFLFEAPAETVGEQKRRAVVMVGRLNPPTRGHYKVIGAMKNFITKNEDLKLDATPVVVIVAGEKSSADKTKNPLTAEERKTFLESSGNANGVKFIVANSAFAAFEEVRKAGFEPIAIAAGSDRATGYLKMLDKYFTKKDGSVIKHVTVPGLERDQDEEVSSGDDAFAMIVRMINDGEKVDDAQISGSLARYTVKNDEKKAFAYLVNLDKKPALADKMFDKIKKAMSE
jgi:hypothetical protein